MNFFFKIKSLFVRTKNADSIADDPIISNENGEDADGIEVHYPFMEVSTSGDENVCPMCRQFDMKLFRASDAPLLPLHPFCGCAYMYHETAGRRKIYHSSDFVLPASCTKEFCNISSKIHTEKDIHKRIELSEVALKLLKDFLSPYVFAGWPPPPELPCPSFLIIDYQSLGAWDNAKRVIETCIDAGYYSQNDGEEELQRNERMKEALQILISFLVDNPGTLQRNIYRKLCPPCDRESLKWVLARSLLIRKEKDGKENRLYVVEA